MRFLLILLILHETSSTALVRNLLTRVGILKYQAPPVKFADTQPRVEIRLSPPRHPLPELTGKIEVLDYARRKTQERLTAKLIKAYDEEKTRARKLITALIREAMSVFDDPAVLPVSAKGPAGSSFFSLPTDTWNNGRIWVSAEAPQPVDGAVIRQVEVLEKKNGNRGVYEAQAMIEDMHEVTRMFLQQLNETLINTFQPIVHTTLGVHAFSSFMAMADDRCMELQAQQLVPSDACNGRATHAHTITALAEEHMYPTVQSLVQNMLERRSVDTNLFRARDVSLMAKLAKEESEIAESLLQAATAGILKSFAPVIQNINMTQPEMETFRRTNFGVPGKLDRVK
jgi:hypothetical protein